MSDDDYDEEDEYLEFEDFPFNEADDLATHTVQSPILVNYDPSWETASYASDWEYYSDEYWEQEPTKKRRKYKEDNVDGMTITNGVHQTQKKQRKTNSNKVPQITLGEPSLAASTVVWKSREETLKPYEGRVINDGQGEKVSILKDWRERFGLDASTHPKSSNQTGNQSIVKDLNSDSPSEVYEESVLPPPPTTLDGPKEIPTRARFPASMSSIQGIPFEDDSVQNAPPFSGDPDMETDSIQPTLGPSMNDQEESADDDPTFSGADSTKALKRDSGILRTQGQSNTIRKRKAQASETLPQATSSREEKGPKRLRKRDSLGATDGKLSEYKTEASVNTKISRGKRKAVVNHDSEDACELETTPIRKRRRPKKQKVLSADEESNEPSGSEPAHPTTPIEKRKPGRPKKHEPSLLNGKIPQRGSKDESNIVAVRVQVPIDLPNGVKASGKRKLEDSEDELAMPPPKRQNSSKNAGKATMNAKTTASTTRRSTRSKKT